MDLGVGSFVLANAIVSRQARDVSSGLSDSPYFVSGSALCKLGPTLFACIDSGTGLVDLRQLLLCYYSGLFV